MTNATFEKVKAALTTAIHSARDAESAAAALVALDAVIADWESAHAEPAPAPEPPAPAASKAHPKK